VRLTAWAGKTWPRGPQTLLLASLLQISGKLLCSSFLNTPIITHLSSLLPSIHQSDRSSPESGQNCPTSCSIRRADFTDLNLCVTAPSVVSEKFSLAA
jgi:hypothetical protein